MKTQEIKSLVLQEMKVPFTVYILHSETSMNLGLIIIRYAKRNLTYGLGTVTVFHADAFLL